MNSNSLQDQSLSNSADEQEIDLIELIQKIWKSKLLILKAIGLAVVVGLIVAFSIPKEYSTTVRLAPEVTDGSSRNNLSGRAAMAGINMNSSNSVDALSLELYPDIVTSTPFISELFTVRIPEPGSNNTITLYEYIDEYQKGPWWGKIIGAPFKLLGFVRNLFSGNDEIGETINDGPIYILSKDEEEVYQSLTGRIHVTVDKETDVITLTVQMQDPFISAQVTQVVLEKLQDFITEYRTQKAKQDLEFTEAVFEDAKQRYYRSQSIYAQFEDANKNIVTASYRAEQERLRNEMSLAYNVYNTLAQKLEQDRLKVQERTPVYTVIEPAKVPLRASSPRKIFILIGFMFLAGVVAVGYILFKDSIRTVAKTIKEE